MPVSAELFYWLFLVSLELRMKILKRSASEHYDEYRYLYQRSGPTT